MKHFQRFELVSLWNVMQTLDVSKIVFLIHSAAFSAFLGTDDNALMNTDLKEKLLREMLELQEEIKKLKFIVSLHHIDSIIELLKSKPFEGETGYFAKSLNLIVNTIRIEASARKFFSMDTNFTDYYADAFSLFPV